MSKELALNGGEKAVSQLPGRYHFGEEEKKAVEALFGSALSSGNAIGYGGMEEDSFCAEFARLTGSGFADGINSGTNAVYAALTALDLPPFSEVVVGCVTDPGGMMPIVINNCIPVPADTSPGSFNAGAREIEERITERTSAIVVPHIGGEPADMESIMKVAGKYNLPVVEDCAQSHLACIGERKVGTFGRYGAYSLMFGKHMCAGGQGGVVVCNTEEDYWRLRRAADRGKPFGLREGDTNMIPALNCNMDEFHAAIAGVQLKKLPGIVSRRRKVVKMFKEMGFENLKSVSFPVLKNGVKHSYWWWRIKFNEKNMNCTKDEFCAALSAEGVMLIANYTSALPANMKWFEDRAEKHPWNNPLYGGNPMKKFPTPNCDRAMKEHFILMLHENYGANEIGMIVSAFEKVEKYYIA